MTEGAELLELMRRRRVCRSYTDEPVDEADLRAIVEAGAAAPSASNARINKFLVVRDPGTIRLVRAVAPGMLGLPTALVVILTDAEKAAREGVRLQLDHRARWADVGSAAQNMLLAAEALGLGACPLMSFSVSGVRTLLELPDHLVPDYVVLLGHPAPRKRAAGPSRRASPVARELTYWEKVS